MKKYSHWLSTPNVVSIAYCEETMPGCDVLRVGVIKKLPQEEVVPPDIVIPPYVLFETPEERVKVLVEQVEEGPIVPLAAPYPGGSHLKTEGLEIYGCAAAIVTFMGRHRLLSAAHVLTNFDRNNRGRSIYLQSYDEINSTRWERAGRVSGQFDVRCYPTAFEADPERATQDLAWADVVEELTSSQRIEWIGSVPDLIRAPIKGEEVKIFGGWSESRFPTEEDPVQYPKVAATRVLTILKVGGPTRFVYFHDVCLLKCPSATLVPGDSGSAIVGKDNAIIGVLFSGGSCMGCYYFCKIPQITANNLYIY